MQPQFFSWLHSTTRANAIKGIQAAKDIPPFVKMALATALAMISDADYYRYGQLLYEVTGALNETPRGQAVLKELGLSETEPTR